MGHISPKRGGTDNDLTHNLGPMVVIEKMNKQTNKPNQKIYIYIQIVINTSTKHRVTQTLARKGSLLRKR